MDHRHAAVVGRGREPGDVGDHAAADRDHDVVAGEPHLGEPAAELGDRGERLVLLAVSDLEQHVRDAGGDRDRQTGLADHRRAPGRRRQQFTELHGGAVADEHVVGALAQRDADATHVAHRPTDVVHGTSWPLMSRSHVPSPRPPRTASTTSANVAAVDVDDCVGDLAVQVLALAEHLLQCARRVVVEQRPMPVTRDTIDEQPRIGLQPHDRRVGDASVARFVGLSTTPPAAAMTLGTEAARASSNTCVSWTR